MSAKSSNTSRSAAPGNGETLDSSILRMLMDNTPDRIYFKDLQSRFVRNNAAHARSLGAASPEDCVGKSDFDFFSREHAEQAFADEQRIIRSGEPLIGKIEKVTMRDGSQAWASTTKLPWRDGGGRIVGTFGLTRDVTAAKEAEERLTEERNLLRTIIDHLPSRLYVKDRDSRYVLNNQSHLASLGVKTQEEAVGRTTLDFFPGERGHQALADDQQVFAQGAAILNQEKSDFGPEGDVHWSLVTKAPLRDTRGSLVGLVGISHDITRRKCAEEALRQNHADMEAELRMARQVQESFLNRPYPVFPAGVPAERSSLRFSHRYLPTTTLGGDFFDILRISDTRCGVLVCDVMGHGVRAGLVTALIRGVVGEMGARATSPAEVLAEINRSLAPILEQTGQPVFATAFFGVIDTEARTITYANAGHPAPLIRHADDPAPERLAPADPEPATGLVPDFAYSRLQSPFRPGDLFLGYTDGLIEAIDAAGTQFGEDGLQQLLSLTHPLGGSEVSDRLLSTVNAFSGREAFEDDVCIVTIEAAAESRPTAQPGGGLKPSRSRRNAP
jgi:sigma-B regulation protein RsbU (phosphoserine phosphatase)